MKVALAHDLLTQLGGAERVLEELHEIFPTAPVFTLLHYKDKTQHRYDTWDVRPSYLQRIPQVFSYKWLLPFMPAAIENMDFTGFDLVISDASALIKGVRLPPGCKHLCYCHTPTRYLWQDRENYVKTLPYPYAVKMAVQPVLNRLKKWDLRAAEKIDLYIANSAEVQGRIKRYYDRDSEVIYPPVDTQFFRPDKNIPKENYFFTASRLEPYKKIDLVVETFNRLNLPLMVAGSGSQLEHLRKLAKPNVRILGRVGDKKLKELFQKSKAFVFPAYEDAGIMMLEAMACGTPVIAYRGGGALEFVEPGVTGEFFEEQIVESLSKAVLEFRASVYSSEKLAEKAKRYDKKVFREKIAAAARKMFGN